MSQKVKGGKDQVFNPTLNNIRHFCTAQRGKTQEIYTIHFMKRMK